MKICFLAPANNNHTKKLCEYFTNKGHEVYVISFVDGKIDNTKVYYINCSVKTNDSDIKKLKYLFSIKKIKKIIKEINPDIINAHYATSYGMIAALCNFKKYILSVWGKDVYIFPKKSILHKLYFKYLINKAPYIFSTSKAMANEINKYTNKKIYITYFGVKLDLFKPVNKKNKFTIGIIKTLEDKYGIKTIIDALEIIKEKRKDIKLECRIAGKGIKEKEYKDYAKSKNINIKWLGYISEKDVANELSKMSVALNPSTDDSDSFGVFCVEAQASSVPIIVSNIPGLLESTTKESRIVIQKNNPNELAEAIIKLYDNPKLREKMGLNGRKYVEKNFEYNKCYNYIEEIFNKIKKR